MAELRRLVSQNSSVEEIQAIGDGLAKDFKAHQDDLARLLVESFLTSSSCCAGLCQRCRVLSRRQGAT